MADQPQDGDGQVAQGDHNARALASADLGAVLVADPVNWASHCPGCRRCGALPRGEPDHLHEPLSGSETRVLPFLPTNPSAPVLRPTIRVGVVMSSQGWAVA